MEASGIGEAAWPDASEEGEILSADAAPPPAKRPRNTEPATCTHEVIMPPGVVAQCQARDLPIPSSFPAFEFPFELDLFQKKALAAIERSESVLVSAHTSAGKTVVAQYAIALSLKRGQRVVYTSPIKALSNQKYRELSAAFGGDVGLMTGDVNVNVDASCLVMTTEILRNMLYKGHELVREAQWVIFDEVHYMRDKERGVIWEECIILLPKAVRFVFLSATVPNGREFAAWVAATHSLPCHLISTPHRPTPLQHWVYPLGGDGLHMLVDESGRFHDASYDAASAALRNGTEQRAAAARVGSRASPELVRLLRLLVEKELTPAIVFSFSRKECEGAAISAKRLEVMPEKQCEAIRMVFDAAISTLSSEDQQIRQVWGAWSHAWAHAWSHAWSHPVHRLPEWALPYALYTQCLISVHYTEPSAAAAALRCVCTTRWGCCCPCSSEAWRCTIRACCPFCARSSRYSSRKGESMHATITPHATSYTRTITPHATRQMLKALAHSCRLPRRTQARPVAFRNGDFLDGRQYASTHRGLHVAAKVGRRAVSAALIR